LNHLFFKHYLFLMNLSKIQIKQRFIFFLMKA